MPLSRRSGIGNGTGLPAHPADRDSRGGGLSGVDGLRNEHALRSASSRCWGEDASRAEPVPAAEWAAVCHSAGPAGAAIYLLSPIQHGFGLLQRGQRLAYRLFGRAVSLDAEGRDSLRLAPTEAIVGRRRGLRRRSNDGFANVRGVQTLGAIHHVEFHTISR